MPKGKPHQDRLQERNTKIYDRYKELYDINGLRNERVLEMLSKEFYLGTQQVQKIIISHKKESKKVIQQTF